MTQLLDGVFNNNIPYSCVYRCPTMNKSGKNKGTQCKNRANYLYKENGLNKYACGTHCKVKNRILLPEEPQEFIDSKLFLQMSTEKPSENNTKYWIFRISEKYSELDCDGKLMFFFKKGAELDNNWYKFINLYDNGELNGINSMKVSTNLYNARSNDCNVGVIICYCGPIHKENSIKEYCNNILHNIKYKQSAVYYKTNDQTLVGTRSMGISQNYLYVFIGS